MARVYQEAHLLNTLSTAVKDLQTQTADLIRSRGIQDEKIKNLTTANLALAAQNDDLQTRLKANEHNATARLANLHIALSPTTSTAHRVLTPLWDVGTGRPMRNFPRHERDIKIMGQAEVIQCLQSLGIKMLGHGAAEKKARLRREIGLPPAE